MSIGDLKVMLSMTDQLSGPAKAAEQNMGSASAGIKGHFGSIVGAAAGLAAGVGGFFALKDGIKSVIDAAGESQQVAAQTTAVLKSTGDASGMSAQQVGDLATQLSKVTPFDDEVIQSGENMLLTFTNIGKDVFPQATKTTLDMATALGENSTQAAMQLGKALNDPVQGVTALQRVGVKLTDGQKEQVKAMVAAGDTMGAQKLILGELTREFGGSAEAAGKTFPGQLAILKTQLGNVEETIGGALLPVLIRMGQFAVPLVVAAVALLSSWLPRISMIVSTQLMPVFATVSNFVTTQVVPNLQRLGQWFMGTGLPAIQRFAQTVQQVFVTQIIPAFQQITTIILPVLERIVTFLQANWKAVLVGAGAIVVTVIVPAFVAWAVAAGTAAVATVVALAPVIALMAAIGLAAGALYLAWQSNFLNIQGIVAAVWAVVQPILQAIVANLSQFWTDTLPKLIAAWQTVSGAVGLAVQAISDVIVPIFTAIAQFISDHATQIKTVLMGVWDVLSGLIQADVDLIEGVIQVGLDLISGNWGQAWDDIKSTLANVWGDMQTALQGAVAALGVIIQDALPAIQAALAQWGQAFLQWIADVAPQIPGALAALISAMNGWIYGTAIPWAAGALEGVGEALIRSLVAGIGNAVGDAEAAARSAVQSVVGAAKGAVTGLVPHFAGGVLDFAGGLAVVGENGPELVNLPRGASVIPHGQSKQMINPVHPGTKADNTAGGGTTVNVYGSPTFHVKQASDSLPDMLRALGV